MSIETRLRELGLTLPAVNPAAARYCPVVIADGWAYTAGQTPKVHGVLRYKGRVGIDLTVEEGQAAARLCALNALANLAAAAGGLDRIQRIVKVTGFVCAGPDFTAHSQVVDGASALLYDLFGEAGAHARSAVGCVSLPGNACCEIELTVRLRP